jgi:hypothetical protein
MEYTKLDCYQVSWIGFIKGLIFGYLCFVLCSCSVTYVLEDPIYEDRDHSTEIYYYSDTELGGLNPYWGYHTGFYYYYGTPHYYPWWYYYQVIPPYHWHSHTHVHVQCDNGYYVYGHRGNKFNNHLSGTYIATIKPRTNRSKTHVFPYNWKSSNSTRNTKIQNNDNRIYVKPNTQHNTSPVIIKNNNTNINRSNNTKVNTKVNTNKNKSNPRINNKVKTTRKPR